MKEVLHYDVIRTTDFGILKHIILLFLLFKDKNCNFNFAYNYGKVLKLNILKIDFVFRLSLAALLTYLCR